MSKILQIAQNYMIEHKFSFKKIPLLVKILDLPVEILNPNQETKKIGEIKES